LHLPGGLNNNDNAFVFSKKYSRFLKSTFESRDGIDSLHTLQGSPEQKCRGVSAEEEPAPNEPRLEIF